MTGKLPSNLRELHLGYAYLVLCPKTGFYKIGSARRPDTRVKQLCREMRTPCTLLHTIATNAALRLEREIQGRFIGGLRGGEWFDLCACDVEVICSVSTVFYRDVVAPKNRLRSEFDRGAKWAEGLPICKG
ncbi:MAG TPA: GIY-YIG nuclease family protein [Gemmata sp.]